MESQGIPGDGFKGFTANRFGRIAEIAKEFLCRRKSIIDFFEAIVDINSNKLVLAVSTYIQNDWFLCCATIYSRLGDDLIFPLMNLLGIDGRGQTLASERNWAGVRKFFEDKLPELNKIRDEAVGEIREGKVGQSRLYASVLNEVLETLERQLSAMSYFSMDGTGEIDEEKLQFAPLTNLGCESEFAKLDNRISTSGGSTSVQTHSRKNVVTTNRLLVEPSFINLPETEKRKQWKWGRISDNVQDVKEIEANYLSTVKMSHRLALMKKEDLKKKKKVKTIKLLETCKEHKGPVTPNSIDILEHLNNKQLITEIAYLRATVAPDIRQMRRVKIDGKFKMEKFSDDGLRQSIKNAVKPEAIPDTDIESLLKTVL